MALSLLQLEGTGDTSMSCIIFCRRTPPRTVLWSNPVPARAAFSCRSAGCSTRPPTNCVITAADVSAHGLRQTDGPGPGRITDRTDEPYRRRTPARWRPRDGTVIGRGQGWRHERAERCNDMRRLAVPDRSKLARPSAVRLRVPSTVEEDSVIQRSVLIDLALRGWPSLFLDHILCCFGIISV